MIRESNGNHGGVRLALGADGAYDVCAGCGGEMIWGRCSRERFERRMSLVWLTSAMLATKMVRDGVGSDDWIGRIASFDSFWVVKDGRLQTQLEHMNDGDSAWAEIQEDVPRALEGCKSQIGVVNRMVGTRFGKVLESQRMLGKAIWDACEPKKTPYRVAVCNKTGSYMVTVRRIRRKNAPITSHGYSGNQKPCGGLEIIDEIS